jgi:protein SCO1/2
MSIRISALLCILWMLLAVSCRKSEEVDLKPIEGIGGNFTLIDMDGNQFEFNSLRGKTVLLFFGYTSCPDACPATMARLTRVYEDLRKKKIENRVRTIFISVDSARDTPEKLKQYLSYFGVQTIGLTGKPEQLAAVARQYGATFERVSTDSEAEYLMDHTTYVYLIDGLGRVRHLIKHEDPPEAITPLVSKLALENCCAPQKK